MTDRITDKHIAILIDRINKTLGTPITYGDRKIDGSFTTNIGHYHINQQYQSYELVQTVNESGAISPVGYTYSRTKREFYDKASVFLAGLEAMRGN